VHMRFSVVPYVHNVVHVWFSVVPYVHNVFFISDMEVASCLSNIYFMTVVRGFLLAVSSVVCHRGKQIHKKVAFG
jgi:hypothetical protein